MNRVPTRILDRVPTEVSGGVAEWLAYTIIAYPCRY